MSCATVAGGRLAPQEAPRRAWAPWRSPRTEVSVKAVVGSQESGMTLAAERVDVGQGDDAHRREGEQHHIREQSNDGRGAETRDRDRRRRHRGAPGDDPGGSQRAEAFASPLHRPP